MWYGIGNTSLPNPSTIRIGLRRDGRYVLFSGAQDIGQGSATVLTQIAADALDVHFGGIDLVMGDTDRTADAGKTSASRQTFVSGNATRLAAADLLRRIETAGPDLAALPEDEDGCIAVGQGSYDPRTTPLDADGQGMPYQTYGFGAQVAVVDVDVELGTTVVRQVIAAHDVGRAINPMLVEGQIHGGIAQGLGFALMEEYVAGRTDNLHDYLIPTIGDIPPIDIDPRRRHRARRSLRREGGRRTCPHPDGARDPRRDPPCDRCPDRPSPGHTGPCPQRHPRLFPGGLTGNHLVSYYRRRG